MQAGNKNRKRQKMRRKRLKERRKTISGQNLGPLTFFPCVYYIKIANVFLATGTKQQTI